MKSNCCLIIDIGKTNVKCLALDQAGQTIWSKSMSNLSIQGEYYLHFDLDAVWKWLVESIKQVTPLYNITTINVSTHGACAVLLDKEGELTLPVLDYEQEINQSFYADYEKIRPNFLQTFSPSLPLGLNLGRQLHYLKTAFSTQFNKTTMLLMYPQYWIWRLTNIAITELTSLGCHTDLWLPEKKCYSSLVSSLGITEMLPPIVSAIKVIGSPSADICEITGLTKECQVFSGVHDSNASFARYLYSIKDQEFTVISTGTWIIAMAASSKMKTNQLVNLKEEKDTLVNVSVLGDMLPCARFMGGREFEQLCQLTQADISKDYSTDDVNYLIAHDIYAMPPFSQTGGPFTQGVGKLLNWHEDNTDTKSKQKNGKALASLYLVLMIDHLLGLTSSTNAIVFGSSAKKNLLMCQMIAQLRPTQRVLFSGDDASTVKGAWCLTRWNEEPDSELCQFEQVKPSKIENLLAYKQTWYDNL
ncbi:MAG: FGGY family carbohydrate kinase [Colwellia sp.]